MLALTDVLPRAFTGRPRGDRGAQEIWPLFALMQPANGAVFALDGILIGAGDTRFLMWGMLAASLGVYVPVALGSLALGLGIVGVWAGLLGLIAVRLVTCGWRFRGAALGCGRARRAPASPSSDGRLGTLARWPPPPVGRRGLRARQGAPRACSPRLDTDTQERRAARDGRRHRAARRRDPRGQRARHGGRRGGRPRTRACSTGSSSTEERLAGIAGDVRAIAALPDPVGETIEGSGCRTGSTCAACACRSESWRWSTRRART